MALWTRSSSVPRRRFRGGPPCFSPRARAPTAAFSSPSSRARFGPASRCSPSQSGTRTGSSTTLGSQWARASLCFCGGCSASLSTGSRSTIFRCTSRAPRRKRTATCLRRMCAPKSRECSRSASPSTRTRTASSSTKQSRTSSLRPRPSSSSAPFKTSTATRSTT
eukprot:Amastigsp_a840988_16.p4 type:complete len:165 gc:universal Amastigsp_a840988_16:762-1256(+)